MANVAGTSIELTINLKHPDHPECTVAKAEYRIVDEAGAVITDWTLLTGAMLGATSSLIVVPASANELPEGQSKAAREIEVCVTSTSGFEYVVGKTYIITSHVGELVPGVNTAVNLAGAQLLSTDIPNTAAWDSASRETRVTAMIEAYERLTRLRFVDCGFTGSLADLEPGDYARLDARVRRAIGLAQLAEADSIIANPEGDQDDRQGVLMDSVGDVTRTFKTVRPVQLAVSKRALAYVSRYVDVVNRMVART